ncbi:hypothetical protein DL96DRAFT_1606960 [Flagelloscypha sp. PMI_526]|nr:hypothetical protein DL96DRAFT_1606960 [Flagelloscypha sp. PMI_526]
MSAGIQPLRDRLNAMLGEIEIFESEWQKATRPAVLLAPCSADSVPLADLPGLKHLRGLIQIDLKLLDKVLQTIKRNPSVNPSYLISVWEQVLRNGLNVSHLFKTVRVSKDPEDSSVFVKQAKPHSKLSQTVKIDIVSHNGRRWQRINTVKNSKIIAEFKELDSYLTDDESEENIREAQISELDSSILVMGSCMFSVSRLLFTLRLARALTRAARDNPVTILDENPPVIPTITLHLTRLDPASIQDPRMDQILEKLHDMGIETVLGPRPLAVYRSLSPPRILPTAQLNLDLSCLRALVSDITHAPLPEMAKECERRFTTNSDTSPAIRKLIERGKSAEGATIHSQQLTAQLLPEIDHELIKTLHNMLVEQAGYSVADIQFWTTNEALQRMLRIVNDIGSDTEKGRAKAIADGDIGGFWASSRHPHQYMPLLPIQIFASSTIETLPELPSTGPLCFRSLYHSAASFWSTPDSNRGRVTPHTVHSMMFGASKNITTITANHQSIRAFSRGLIPASEEGIASIWSIGPRNLTSGAGELREE